MRDDPYVVDPLSEIKLSWLVRRRLRRVRQRHETGVLMHGIIRTPVRSMSPKNPVVGIREGKTWLTTASSATLTRLPQWAPLASGEHHLTFRAFRVRSGSSFDRRFVLAEGDVLVAICEPIQPWTIFGKSPSADHWYMDVITQAAQRCIRLPPRTRSRRAGDG
jgi:hypothetical protein